MVDRVRSLLADRHVRSLGRKGGALVVGELAGGLLIVTLALVLARSFGATVFGQFALITTSVVLVSQLIDVRVWEAATRYASEYISKGEPVRGRAVLELALAVNFIGGLVATAILIVAAQLIADELVKDSALAGSVATYAFVAPFVAVQGAAGATFRVFDRFALLGSLTAMVPAMRLAAAGLALALGASLHGVLWALLAAEAIAAVAFAGVALKVMADRAPSAARTRERLRQIRHELPRMGRFLAASNVTGSLRLLNLQLDVLVVGFFATPAVAGSLKVARTFTAPLTLLWGPFYHAIYPHLVRDVAAGRFGDMRRLVRRMSAAAALLVTPAAVAIAALCPLVIPFLLGDGFGQAPETVVPLAAAGLVTAVLFWAHPAALALDMQMVSLRALAIATVAQVGLLLVLVPALDAPGAGLAFLAFTLIWMGLLVPPVLRRLSARHATQAPATGAPGRLEAETSPT